MARNAGSVSVTVTVRWVMNVFVVDTGGKTVCVELTPYVTVGGLQQAVTLPSLALLGTGASSLGRGVGCHW